MGENRNYLAMTPTQVVAYTYKSGSTTIRNCLGGRAQQKNVSQFWVRSNAKEVILFVRRPLPRLASAWRWWRSQGSWPTGFHDWPRDLPWEGFVDNVLAGSSDPHWAPQYDQHVWRRGDMRFFLPTTLYRLEDLSLVLRDRFNVRSPRWDKETDPNAFEQDLNYRKSEILDFYQADQTLWESALPPQETTS